MKKSTNIRVFCLSLLILISFTDLIGFCLSYKNAPYDNKNPADIEYYSFQERESDYGTHDWIADAALRFLYEKNASKWNWLFHDRYDTAPDITLKRNPNYRDFNGKHNILRSYLYFLLGTHWPDFGNAPVLELEEEGEEIRNYKYGLKKWIGDTHYHNYFYNVIESNNSLGFEFIGKDKNFKGSPKIYQKAPKYAYRFGDLAVQCLSHQEENKEGKKESWAKVETAAFYMGCMTHYVSDLSSIPHILKPNDLDPKGNTVINYYDTHKFHQWYERNIEYFTYWGNSRKNIGAGPNDDFFRIDLEKINQKVGSIIPIEPDLAAVGLSKTVIRKAFGEIKGEIFPKNLYINQDHNDVINDWWTWEFSQRENDIEIVPGALTYKEYFDKVEKILIYAIFYTACAMLWVREKVEEKTRNINTDKWAKIPFDKKKDAQPVDVPDKSKVLSKEREEKYKTLEPLDWFPQVAIMAPIFALVIIPYIISTSKKVITS